MTNHPNPPEPAPASRPMILLAVEPDGTVAAAWEMDAYSPGGLLAQVSQIVASGEAAYVDAPHATSFRVRNPARWLVFDRHSAPGGFWAALIGGEIPPADVVAAAPALVTGDPGAPGRRPRYEDRRGLATPPRDLPLAGRARWVARYILRGQASIMAHPGLVFHGIPAAMPGTGDIAIETSTPGGFLVPLGNAGYYHSPSGFGWGGGSLGSGPAATARSLLAAALGRRAACPACRGKGEIPADGPNPARDCLACDGLGIGIPGTVYHRYKEEVVAGLPEDTEWYLPRAAVLAWLERQRVSPRLAQLARDVPR
jgi:hypothetical protein